MWSTRPEIESALLGFILTRPHALAQIRKFGILPQHFESVAAQELYMEVCCVADEDPEAIWGWGGLSIRLPHLASFIWVLEEEAPCTLEIEPFLKAFADGLWARKAETTLRRSLAVLQARKAWDAAKPLRNEILIILGDL